MKKITVKRGQSLLDISLQEYGDTTGVFDIVERNGLRGVTDNVYEGEVIEVSGVANAIRVKNFLSNYEISTLTIAAERADGIGWMVIGYNFIIT